MEYNFAVFGKNYQHLIAQFSDLKKVNVPYIEDVWKPKNLFLKTIYDFTMKKSDNFLKKKLKYIVNSICFYSHFYDSRLETKDKPMIFIFLSTWVWAVERGYGVWLKKKYPGCKLVLLLTDSLHKYSYFNMELVKTFFDWMVSYNIQDVVKYNMGYSMNVNTRLFPKQDEEVIYDVSFVGAARDRLEDIHAAYEILSEAGLKCDFYVVDVPPEKQMKESHINYNQMLSYYEIQRKVIQSRCLLEITQKHANGITCRADEAWMYNKKLMTNVAAVKNTRFYNKDSIFVFSEVKDIDPQWIKKQNNIDYQYCDDVSPVELIKVIENHFSRNPCFPCSKWQTGLTGELKKISMEQM